MKKTNLSIQNNIKKILLTNNISVRDLERRSGLKYSVIQNILLGRSKNPTINVLQSIAQELNCSVDSLIDDSVINSDTFKILSNNEKDVHFIDGLWNNKLFINTSIIVQKIFLEKQINSKNKKAILCIIEIYNYSLKNHCTEEPDIKFAEWIIEKFLNKNSDYSD